MPGKGDQIKGGFTGNTGGHSYQRTGCWPGEALRSATSQLSLLPGLFCRVGSIVLPFLFRDLRQLKPVQAPSTITRGLFNQSSRLPAMLTDYSLLCNGVPTSSPGTRWFYSQDQHWQATTSTCPEKLPCTHHHFPLGGACSEKKGR